MADFRRIAVFILGTVARNGRFEQPFPTYLESRILPLLQTWGQFFPHLYFVFGRNVHDVNFLTERCMLTTSNALSSPSIGWEHMPRTTHRSGNRQLKVRSPQVKLEHSLDLYRCPVNADDLFYFRSTPDEERLNLTTTSSMKSSEEATGAILEFNVLLARNCTGEYFGYGPTCRCQEAMRFFHDVLMRKHAIEDLRWFAFMDDDVHLRPHSLVALLDAVAVAGPRRVVLVPSCKQPAFEFHKKRTPGGAWEADPACSNSSVFNFGWIQPAFMTREALSFMYNSIERDGLTGLQSVWGGSHDALLGLLVWMYSIPTYAFESSYSGTTLYADRGKIIFPPNFRQTHYRPALHFIFHKVGSRVQHHQHNHHHQKKGVADQRSVLAGHYDVAAFLGDSDLYRGHTIAILLAKALNRSSINSSALLQLDEDEYSALKKRSPQLATLYRTQLLSRRPAFDEGQLIAAQRRVGMNAFESLVQQPHSSVNQTAFRSIARTIHVNYEPFLPKHCALRTRS